MHPPTNISYRPLRYLPASLTGLRFLSLRALTSLWKRTAGRRFALAPGYAGNMLHELPYGSTDPAKMGRWWKRATGQNPPEEIRGGLQQGGAA